MQHGPSGSAGRGSPSPGGDTITSSPFEGVAEATPETWASMMSGGKEGGGNGALPRTVGVFFLDRYSEGFGSALEAAENAAELATVRLGGEGSGGGGGFVWVDAPCQEGFAKTLGVSDASVSRGVLHSSHVHRTRQQSRISCFDGVGLDALFLYFLSSQSRGRVLVLKGKQYWYFYMELSRGDGTEPVRAILLMNSL